MFNFFKKKSKYPPFRLSWTFDKRNQYFVRNAQWGWLDDEHIFVTDNRSLQTTALESWPQMIFMHANGQITATDYVRFIADQYENDIPVTLDQTILHELLQLASRQLVRFSSTPQTVPADFDVPGFKV